MGYYGHGTHFEVKKKGHAIKDNLITDLTIFFHYLGICADKKPRACFRKVRRLSPDEKREYCKKRWPTSQCQRTCGICLK